MSYDLVPAGNGGVVAGTMKVWAAIVLAAVIGCTQADERYSAAMKDQIKTGMTADEVEAVLGKNYTTAIDMGGMRVCQWVRGERDATSSIIVSYKDGKVAEVAGTNLK